MKKIIITTGEPAGVGPDIVLTASMRNWSAHLVVIGDRDLLANRAKLIGADVKLKPYNSTDESSPHIEGELPVIHLPLKTSCRPGALTQENVGYVLAQLDLATASCLAGEFSAMVTAPVQKSLINDAGIEFSGHTEHIGQLTGASFTVMLMVANGLRVALATTHLPLNSVTRQINAEQIQRDIQLIHQELENRFHISAPRITVLGLNPHAGEGGYLGNEEINVISPACGWLRGIGFNVRGPIPADTAFIPKIRTETDVYFAMYHDQGLPVIKALGFEEVTNITLGLPFLRTSVDHGTGLDLAGTGSARDNSMQKAIDTAINLSAA